MIKLFNDFYNRFIKYGVVIRPLIVTLGWFNVGWGVDLLELNFGWNKRCLLRLYYETRFGFTGPHWEIDIFFFHIIKRN